MRRKNWVKWLRAELWLSSPVLFAIAGVRGCMTQHTRPIGQQDMTFDVSPDGHEIVFNASGEGGRDLYRLDLVRRKVTLVARTPEYETAPRFSPDGRSIVYAAGRDGDRADHLFVCSVDGSGRRQITSGDNNDCSPVFTPDGSRILFTRDTEYRWGGLASSWIGGGAVWSVRTDGSDARHIPTRGNATVSAPRFFTPDDRSLFYMKEEWPDGPSGVPVHSLWRVGTSGTGAARVASSFLFDAPLRWQP
jgi:Tol biopolymer transport system component